MKKIISIMLCAILCTTAIFFTSCTNENGTEVPADVVSVQIVNAIDDSVILDTMVALKEEMTVLEATVEALINAEIAYELDEEGTNLISIDGLEDFLYSENTENENHWIYQLNGENSYANEDTYSPATQILAANDVIVWEYDAATVEE